MVCTQPFNKTIQFGLSCLLLETPQRSEPSNNALSNHGNDHGNHGNDSEQNCNKSSNSGM